MPDSQNKRKQAIESLLAERKKFEAWLAQLDTRRASTAEHVFTRVLADYTKRLDSVREQLAAEADGIRSLVAELEGRLATEQALVTEKSDERAELELRATVGEFSEKEWNATRARLDGAIAEIRTTFESTERELVEMRETLRGVTAPSAPASEGAASRGEPRVSASVTAAVTAAEASAAEAVAPPPPAPPAPRATAPGPRHRTPFDELAFLKSVAGTPTTPTPMKPVPGADAIPEPQAEPDPEPEVQPDPEDKTTPELGASPEGLAADGVEGEGEPDADTVEDVEGRPHRDAEESFDMTPEPMFNSASEPDSGPRPARSRGSSKTPVPESSAFGAPTPRTSQAIRSLKCQECGTLNFPTEWYCERCGGELAAF